MLKSMRKNSKYFLWLFVIVILSFIFWGVGTQDKNNNTPVLAKIGEDRIMSEEYWRAYDRMVDVYREVYAEKFDDEMREQLKETVLASLVQERVLYQAAMEMGIKVTDDELQEAIMNEPTFRRDGAFSSAIYQNTLRLNRLTPAGYEALKRRELLVTKARELIEDSVDLLPSETEVISGDPKMMETLTEALLEQKKQAALRSYVEGYKTGLEIEINRDLLS